MQLNLTRADLDQCEVEPGRRVEVEHSGDRYYAVAARTTFADARAGEIILYEDAYENIALAISGGNAAQTFNVSPGAELHLRRGTHEHRSKHGPAVRTRRHESGRPSRPRLWKFFRGPMRGMFDKIAPVWDEGRVTRSRRSRPLSSGSRSRARAGSGDQDWDRCSPGRAALPRNGGRRGPRPLAGHDRGRGWACRAGRSGPVRRGRRRATPVRGRVVRPRDARQHDPVLRRARPRGGSGGSVVFKVVGRARDADLRAAGGAEPRARGPRLHGMSEIGKRHRVRCPQGLASLAASNGRFMARRHRPGRPFNLRA